MSEWQDIETAPSWKNTYTLQRIDWEPTHWMPLPKPPVSTHNPEKEE